MKPTLVTGSPIMFNTKGQRINNVVIVDSTTGSYTHCTPTEAARHIAPRSSGKWGRTYVLRRLPKQGSRTIFGKQVWRI